MIIYKITNRVNGMVYIGQTKRKLDVRWKQHIYDANKWFACHKFQEAIKEYGPENFVVEQIDCAATKEEADEKEILWIKQYDSMENGYNCSPGGKNSGHRRKVMSLETGKVYGTIKEAALDVGRTCGSISQALDKAHLTSAGQHWKSVK